MYLSSCYSYKWKHTWLFISWPYIGLNLLWNAFPFKYSWGLRWNGTIPCPISCWLLLPTTEYDFYWYSQNPTPLWLPMVQFIHWLITASEVISNFSTLLGIHACPDTWIHCTRCVSQKIPQNLVPIVSWSEFLLCEHKRNDPVGQDYYIIVPTDAFGLCHSMQRIHFILINSSHFL